MGLITIHGSCQSSSLCPDSLLETGSCRGLEVPSWASWGCSWGRSISSGLKSIFTRSSACTRSCKDKPLASGPGTHHRLGATSWRTRCFLCGLRSHPLPSRSWAEVAEMVPSEGPRTRVTPQSCPPRSLPGALLTRKEGPGTTVTQCQSKESLWTPQPSVSFPSKHRQWDWGRRKQNRGPASNRPWRHQLLSPSRCVEHPK